MELHKIEQGRGVAFYYPNKKKTGFDRRVGVIENVEQKGNDFLVTISEKLLDENGGVYEQYRRFYSKKAIVA